MGNVYPKGFCTWVKRESKDDIQAASEILRHTLKTNPRSTNIVWDILNATGELKFNQAAFLKAAENVLNSVKEVV